jgi:hypothetical protein
MTPAPRPFYTTYAETQRMFLTLCNLLSHHPEAVGSAAKWLAELLCQRLNLVQKSKSFEVEAALEALTIEGGIVA